MTDVAHRRWQRCSKARTPGTFRSEWVLGIAAAIVAGTFGLVWNEINVLDDRIENRFDQVETRLEQHGERLTRIGTKLENFEIQLTASTVLEPPLSGQPATSRTREQVATTPDVHGNRNERGYQMAP